MAEQEYEFQKDKVLIVVEDGEVSYVVATEDIDVTILNRDEEDFDDFHNIDQLDEVVDHETMDQVINGIIEEFQEDFRTADTEDDDMP